MSGINTLAEADLRLITSRTIVYLRHKICGGIHDIIIGDPDELFLAYPDNNLHNTHPEELESVSVVEGIQATYELLKRRNQFSKVIPERQDLHEKQIRRISAEVIRILNKKSVKINPSDNRVQGILDERMEEYENKLRKLWSLCEDTMVQCCFSDHIGERALLLENIDDYLRKITAQQQEIDTLEKNYGIWANDGQELLHADSGSEGYLKIDWKQEKVPNEGSMVECRDQIPFSSSESYLRRFVPNSIQANTALFSEMFTWEITQQQQEEGRVDINDYPASHLEHQRALLKRKMTIYIYGQKYTDQNANVKKAVRDSMETLCDEIVSLNQNIQSIRQHPDFSESAHTTNETELKFLSDEKQSEDITVLEKTKNELFNERNILLRKFYSSEPGLRELLISRIHLITKRLAHITQQISHLSSRNVEVTIEQSDTLHEGERADTDIIEDMVADVDFYKNIPTHINAPFTQSERAIIEDNGIMQFFSDGEVLNDIEAVIQSRSEKSAEQQIEKMRDMSVILEMVISRKLYVYFLACSAGETSEEEENLDQLHGEIKLLIIAEKILKRRLSWIKNPENKGPDLIKEIGEIESFRLHSLKKYFEFCSQREIPEMLAFLGQNILNLTLSLEERRKELNACGYDNSNAIAFPLAKMTSEENHLSFYIPEDVREGEVELFGTSVTYIPQRNWSRARNRTEAKKLSQNRAHERALMIFFFGGKRTHEIIQELEGEKNKQKRKILNAEGVSVDKLLGDLSQTLAKYIYAEQNGIAVDANILEYQPLYNEAISALADLESLYADNVGASEIRLITDRYWNKIHQAISNFAESIRSLKIKDKKNIQELQKGFKKIMKGIIKLLNDELILSLESVGSNSQAPEEMAGFIRSTLKKLSASNKY